MEARTGPMDIPAFRGQGHVVVQKPMGSDSGVIVELERPTQIGRPDAVAVTPAPRSTNGIQGVPVAKL